jgi:hypothetical protein
VSQSVLRAEKSAEGSVRPLDPLELPRILYHGLNLGFVPDHIGSFEELADPRTSQAINAKAVKSPPIPLPVLSDRSPVEASLQNA